MTERVVRKFGRLALGLSPVVIVAAGLQIGLQWMKPQNPVVVEVLTMAAGIFVLAYTVFLARRESRRWDEVQKASWGFATGNGWASGGFATLVLLMVPPVMNWLVDLVNGLASARGPGSPDITKAVRIAFFFGVTLVMVMQTLAIFVASAVWRRRMGGVGEQS